MSEDKIKLDKLIMACRELKDSYNNAFSHFETEMDNMFWEFRKRIEEAEK